MNTGRQGSSNGCVLCKLKSVGDWQTHTSGRKHQYFLQKEVIRERERNGIYITGIPRGFDVQILRHSLENYGEISEFFHHPRGNYVIASFNSRDSATAVLKSNFLFGGTRLIIKRRKLTVPEPEPQEESLPTEEPGRPDFFRVLNILASGGTMEDFLRELEVPQSDKEKHNMLVNDLVKLIETKFKRCRANVFGSMRTGLCMKGSDIDVFLDVEDAREQIGDISDMSLPEKMVRIGQRMMHQSKGVFTQIRPIARAKTPIIKFVHFPTGVACDVSFKNTLGVANSELIKHYIALDSRVYTYFMVIKYWAYKHGFSGSGKITNYALVTMAAFYLQQLEEPVLPTVHKLQELSKERERVDGWLCSFNNDPKAIEPSKNKSTIFELLAGFFNYYDRLNIGDLVICPFLGKTVPKVHFVEPDKLPEPLKTIYQEEVPVDKGLRVISDLCVQDPFELIHNLTACTGMQGLKLFQAFTKVTNNVCRELLAAPEKNKLSSLGKLFTVQPQIIDRRAICRLTDSEMTLSIFAYGFLSLSLFIDAEKSGKDEIDEESVSRKWFLLIHNLVNDIFTKVMLFEVEWMPEDQRAKKVMKMDSPSDVHDTVNTVKVDQSILDVKGNYALWDNRKKFVRAIVPPDSHCIDVEAAITDALYKSYYQEHAPPKKPIVRFTCEFINYNNPPSVKLLCKDTGSQKGLFNRAMGYLQSKIPRLIEKYCKYMKQKARGGSGEAENVQKESPAEDVTNDNGVEEEAMRVWSKEVDGDDKDLNAWDQ